MLARCKSTAYTDCLVAILRLLLLLMILLKMLIEMMLRMIQCNSGGQQMIARILDQMFIERHSITNETGHCLTDFFPLPVFSVEDVQIFGCVGISGEDSLFRALYSSIFLIDS